MMPSLPGYTLCDRLSETPSRRVFRAYRNADRTPVVLKVLCGDCKRPEPIARLKHEYRILSSVQSPYIVGALGWVESAEAIALVLEDLGDLSARQLVAPGGMDIRAFLQLAMAMAGAVDSVHQHHLVHKDIKPNHFLLNEATGQPKLIDFGIATDLPWQLQQLINVQELEGTLAYLSPEQTGRMDRVLDRRTDLYSLGVTLHELLTGSLPFRSTDPLELIHSHVARAPQHPCELRPDIPDLLGEIILKLLSKVAEERYHTAAGLRADLEACVGILDSKGRPSPVSLGAYDVSDEMCIARKLYGRNDEVRALQMALERICQGAAELWLVRGPSGVGKSALVRDIHQQVPLNGRFVAGKFAHVDRGTPYAPIAQSCRALVQSILGERAEVLNVWRQRLQEAVGTNGQLVIDLVPELELVIGRQPPLQHLDASEAQHRFELVLQNFFRVFTAQDRPLVLFLDDLQWADPASLRWLQLVLTAPNRGYLLVVGAYRDNEVVVGHPLETMLQELAKAEAVVHSMALMPLELAQICRLLADTLACSTERVRPLAVLIQAKTGGNPFFIDQLMHELYRAGLLWFDGLQRMWDWDLRKIELVTPTENVADLMVTKLARLPESTFRILRLAACIGHEFDCQALAVISEQQPTRVAQALDAALREGFVLPLDAELHNWIRADASNDTLLDARKVFYRFLHDRVQQATFETIEPSARGPVYLDIGRLMLTRSGGRPSDDQLFAIVDYLNRGAACIEATEERVALALLNLRAGRKARDAAAHDAASRLLATALELLGHDAWSTDYASAHAAHVTKAECEFLVGNVDAAFELLDAAEAHARNVLERAAARELKTAMLTRMNRLPEAVELALDTARLLGAEFPRDKDAIARALGQEFGLLQTALAGREIESLIDLPPMTDPTKLALVNVLFKAGAAEFQFNPDLMALTVVKVLNLALQYGNAAVMPYFYESYGIIHPVITGDYETAYRFGRLGVELYSQSGLSPVGGATHFVFAAFTSHWWRPLSASSEHLSRGLNASLEVGDYIHAGYCLCLDVFHRFYQGERLDGLLGCLKGVAEQLERTDDVINLRQLAILGQVWRSLIGATRAPGRLDDDAFDESEFCRSFQGNRSLHVYYHVHKALALFYAGDCAGALSAADEAVPLQPGLFMGVEHCLYRALALASQCWTASPEDRRGRMDALRVEEAKLRAWAQSASHDHTHRHALVAAELAALEGDFDRAGELYDRSIGLAQTHGALHIGALAAELCGEQYLRRGHHQIAYSRLVDAYRGYLDWGAHARADRMLSQHPDLPVSASSGLATRSGASASRIHSRVRNSDVGATIGSVTTAGNGQFDLMTAVRVSQAIASELELDKVLDRLLRVLLEHAGAQKACLVLARDDRLEIEACATIDPDVVRLRLGEPVSTSSRLAATVVQYVARSRESVAVADAATDPLFARDPYVAAMRPKSLLCLPMQHRGHLVGVLYLENNAATHVFSPSRLELLQFLVAQAAVAVENAKLYGEVRAASALLQRSNEELEAQVAQRTEQLSRALAELWSEMDLARKIQTVLLPTERRIGSCEIAASMIPASSVGGDYYDTFQCGDSSWLLIGDVSGHGVAAGLSMMMVQTAVRAVVQTAAARPGQVTPAELLVRVNAVVSGNLSRVKRGQYMTLAAIEIRGATVRHAGLHMDFLLYRASSGETQRIPTAGMWVGVVDDIAPLVQDSEFELEEGDVFLLFTDGITETMVGERRLGTDGLAALLRHFAGQSSDPESIVRGINRRMDVAAAPDDMTLVAVRYSPKPGELTWTKN